MAHLAGIYATDEHAPHASELFALLTRRFGDPQATLSVGPIRASVFPQHAGERIVAPWIEGGSGSGDAVGFGGSDKPIPTDRLVPPWVVCHYDRARKTAIIRTDRHGFALLYVRSIGPCIAFCTSAAALGRLPPPPDPDLSAWAEFLAFDQLLGERTMRRGISAIPEGCDLEIGPDGIALPRRFRYTDIELSAQARRRPVTMDLVARWRDAMASLWEQHGAGGTVLVPLSGGLDSRLLAASAKEAGARVEAFTFGRQDIGEDQVPDVAIAREVSRVLGIPWRFLPLEDDWLATHARRAAELTDGQIDVVHSYGISVLDAFPPGLLRLDGLAGDLVLGGSYLTKELMSVGTHDERIEVIWRRRARISQPAWQDLLLAEARSEILGRVRASVQESFAPAVYTSGRKLDPRWSDFWAIRHRVRRFTMNGPLLWRAVCRSVFPFFIPGFIDHLLALPPRMRLGAALQSSFLHGGWPEIARIPWQKTGRSVPRGTLWDTLTKGIRRPAFPPRGPFYDFNAAFRRSARLRAFVQDTLLDSRSGIARLGCFDRGAVEKLLKDTAGGARAGMPQIGALLSLVLSEEVWSSPA